MSKGNKGQLWCSLIGNRDYRYIKTSGLILTGVQTDQEFWPEPNRNRIWVDLAGTGPHFTISQLNKWPGLNQIGWILSDFPKSNFSRGISLIKINIMKVDIGKIVSTEFE